MAESDPYEKRLQVVQKPERLGDSSGEWKLPNHFFRCKKPDTKRDGKSEANKLLERQSQLEPRVSSFSVQKQVEINVEAKKTTIPPKIINTPDKSKGERTKTDDHFYSGIACWKGKLVNTLNMPWSKGRKVFIAYPAIRQLKRTNPQRHTKVCSSAQQKRAELCNMRLPILAKWKKIHR